MLKPIQYHSQMMQIKMALRSNSFQAECLCQEWQNYQALQQIILKNPACLSVLAFLNDVKCLDIQDLNQYNATEYESKVLLLPYYQNIKWHQLELEEKINFAQQIIAIVKTLHQLDWLHGDLKLSHFLYDELHQHVVLIDFALAQDLKQSNQPDSPLHATPAYMSPELFHAQAKQKGSDIYALGVILYEVFCGKKPFVEKTYQDWAIAHCQQAVEALPLSIFKEASQWQYWQGLIDQMLTKRLAYRLQDLNLIEFEKMEITSK